MNRPVYRIILTLFLIVFAFAFYYQVSQLISRSQIMSQPIESVPSKESDRLAESAQKVETPFKKEPNRVLTFAKESVKPVKTGFLEGTRDFYDLIIVGAGLSGAVFAEQARYGTKITAIFGLVSLKQTRKLSEFLQFTAVVYMFFAETGPATMHQSDVILHAV